MMEMGATFWFDDEESLTLSQRMSTICGLNLKKIISKYEDKTFLLLPGPLEFAHMMWHIGCAGKLPPLYYKLPIFFSSTEKIFLCQLGKWDVRIDMQKKEICLPDFFSHWISIPLSLNYLEAPGAMTLRWQLPVAEGFLREVVVLYNGQIFFPPEMLPVM